MGLEVTGIDEVIARFQAARGPELAKLCGQVIQSTAKSVLAPKMAAAAPTARGPKPGDGYARRSLRDKRIYTARKVRLRARETAAYSVKAREWYAHFPVTGTKPHLIKPKRAPSLFVPSVGFVPEITHPGSASNPYPERAGQGVEQVFAQALEKNLIKRLTTPRRTRKAKA